MSSTRPIQSVSTAELYSRWAKVYDKDGNILQSLDDYLLPPLLNTVFPLLQQTPLTIIELGTGTGRNTVKLLSPELPIKVEKINALDLSPAMLDVARERCAAFTSSFTSESEMSGLLPLPLVEFYEFDALQPIKFPAVKELEGKADLLLSTLVLEHLPLATFFSTLKNLVREGGYAVVTNMHAEMGRLGQAGFLDEETGEKVRGTSYVYEVAEVVEEGRKWGFEVVGEVGERGVEAGDIEGGIVGERGRKWVGVKCWFGMVFRLGGEV